MSRSEIRTLGMPVTRPVLGLPAEVTVYEVGPRDGLQSVPATLSAADKVGLIVDLLDAGLPYVEATSFVSPRLLPQLADGEEVLRRLAEQDVDLLSRCPVLVPNEQGYRRAVEAGATAVAVVVSASESFSLQNLNAARTTALRRATEIVEIARADGHSARGYVSMVAGDPWEGAVPLSDVVEASTALLEAGCYEISLGDTIGVATPGLVSALLEAHLSAGISIDHIALHLHDTYGQAVANVYEGLRNGVSTFDASVGGLGGCPFARSSSGNLATEDLLWMLEGLGITTGVDLERVMSAGAMARRTLGITTPSRVAQALV